MNGNQIPNPSMNQHPYFIASQPQLSTQHGNQVFGMASANKIPLYSAIAPVSGTNASGHSLFSVETQHLQLVQSHPVAGMQRQQPFLVNTLQVPMNVSVLTNSGLRMSLQPQAKLNSDCSSSHVSQSQHPSGSNQVPKPTTDQFGNLQNCFPGIVTLLVQQSDLTPAANPGHILTGPVTVGLCSDDGSLQRVQEQTKIPEVNGEKLMQTSSSLPTGQSASSGLANNSFVLASQPVIISSTISPPTCSSADSNAPPPPPTISQSLQSKPNPSRFQGWNTSFSGKSGAHTTPSYSHCPPPPPPHHHHQQDLMHSSKPTHTHNSTNSTSSVHQHALTGQSNLFAVRTSHETSRNRTSIPVTASNPKDDPACGGASTQQNVQQVFKEVRTVPVFLRNHKMLKAIRLVLEKSIRRREAATILIMPNTSSGYEKTQSFVQQLCQSDVPMRNTSATDTTDALSGSDPKGDSRDKNSNRPSVDGTNIVVQTIRGQLKTHVHIHRAVAVVPPISQQSTDDHEGKKQNCDKQPFKIQSVWSLAGENTGESLHESGCHPSVIDWSSVKSSSDHKTVEDQDCCQNGVPAGHCAPNSSQLTGQKSDAAECPKVDGGIIDSLKSKNEEISIQPQEYQTTNTQSNQNYGQLGGLDGPRHVLSRSMVKYTLGMLKELVADLEAEDVKQGSRSDHGPDVVETLLGLYWGGSSYNYMVAKAEGAIQNILQEATEFHMADESVVFDGMRMDDLYQLRDRFYILNRDSDVYKPEHTNLSNPYIHDKETVTDTVKSDHREVQDLPEGEEQYDCGILELGNKPEKDHTKCQKSSGVFPVKSTVLSEDATKFFDCRESLTGSFSHKEPTSPALCFGEELNQDFPKMKIQVLSPDEVKALSKILYEDRKEGSSTSPPGALHSHAGDATEVGPVSSQQGCANQQRIHAETGDGKTLDLCKGVPSISALIKLVKGIDRHIPVADKKLNDKGKRTLFKKRPHSCRTKALNVKDTRDPRCLPHDDRNAQKSCGIMAPKQLLNGPGISQKGCVSPPKRVHGPRSMPYPYHRIAFDSRVTPSTKGFVRNDEKEWLEHDGEDQAVHKLTKSHGLERQCTAPQVIARLAVTPSPVRKLMKPGDKKPGSQVKGQNEEQKKDRLLIDHGMRCSRSVSATQSVPPQKRKRDMNKSVEEHLDRQELTHRTVLQQPTTEKATEALAITQDITKSSVKQKKRKCEHRTPSSVTSSAKEKVRKTWVSTYVPTNVKSRRPSDQTEEGRRRFSSVHQSLNQVTNKSKLRTLSQTVKPDMGPLIIELRKHVQERKAKELVSRESFFQ